MTVIRALKQVHVTNKVGALDLIRGNLVQPALMTPLPLELPGSDNDLNEKLDQINSAR